ncbi:N-acyl-D-amino-acid deacylase family protein [Nocardia sp. CA-135953]|uniref:N-acyl-D-amino-acid deacylase family protein n=1 Tax=Nocardia sp. CA-135953 TaxID=3239978 RepID=UPI003D99190D
MRDAFDLVIRGGTVLDGTGADPIEADVAVTDGRIAAVGKVSGRGAEEIDARDRLVTPGFVDVHTHYDGQVTWEQTLGPSSGHGVTTVVMGNCGVGFAPARAEQRDLLVRLMEGVEDIPGVVMTTGVPWNWETFPDYLDALDRRHTDIDFAAQVPHSPLRVYVMGQRGADLEPPTDADLNEMRRLTAEAVRAGALGVSTSRTMAHRFKTGELAPSVPTEDTEILALADGLRDAGTGVFQLVPNNELDPNTQFALLRRIAERSGRPVSFTFLQDPGWPGGWRDILRSLETARDDGHSIRGQVLARPVGALLGLELSLHPFALHPSFRPLRDLPLPDKVQAMRDPGLRRRLLAEQPEDPNPFFKFVISDHESLYVLGDPPNYHPAADDSISAKARRDGREPLEVIYEALLERDGHEILYRPMGNRDGDRFESAGRDMVPHDLTVLALGDGGAHYSTICDAAYPTYFLTHWVRDATADRRIELPQAIRMLTTQPAAAVDLGDRGVIRRGAKADLNVIDLDRLHLHAPHTTYDLPAGGRRLRQRADGYDATVVSGLVTYLGGEATGALPGRLVRGARRSSAAA